LKSDGTTDTARLAWSGDVLMDLNDRQALTMASKTIDGVDYLLVEAGGFSQKKKDEYVPDYPEDWAPPWMVMKKAEQ
jgi:hypothetical protein